MYVFMYVCGRAWGTAWVVFELRAGIECVGRAGGERKLIWRLIFGEKISCVEDGGLARARGSVHGSERAVYLSERGKIGREGYR